MISRCSTDSPVRHSRNASPVSFFVTVTSRSSDVSVGGAIFQLNVLPAPQRRKSLEARDCQEPGGDSGSAFKLAGLTPDVEKDPGDEIFRSLLVADEPKPETIHPDMVPSVQHLHGEPVALSNPGDQDFVRSRLGGTQ